MAIRKVKRKEDIQDLHVVQGPEDKLVIFHFVDTACNFGKELDLSWRILYQSFTHDDYSQLPFDDVIEDQDKEAYRKIICSQLHKVVARPIIVPCGEVVGILVQ